MGDPNAGYLMQLVYLPWERIYCGTLLRFTMENHMGLSENSVPLNPMVNDNYPYEKWL